MVRNYWNTLNWNFVTWCESWRSTGKSTVRLGGLGNNIHRYNSKVVVSPEDWDQFHQPDSTELHQVSLSTAQRRGLLLKPWFFVFFALENISNQVLSSCCLGLFSSHLFSQKKNATGKKVFLKAFYMSWHTKHVKHLHIKDLLSVCFFGTFNLIHVNSL